MLANLKAEIGGLERVTGWVRVFDVDFEFAPVGGDQGKCAEGFLRRFLLDKAADGEEDRRIRGRCCRSEGVEIDAVRVVDHLLGRCAELEQSLEAPDTGPVERALETERVHRPAVDQDHHPVVRGCGE